MFKFNINYDKRIYGFDLIRALAVFFVIHGHGRHLLTGTALEGFPWINLPHGVDIFFVLSGFLIGFSFISNAEKNGGKLTFKRSLNFWKRSALRILPNYYLILLVNYFLVENNLLNGSTDQFGIWRFATFTQNLFYPFYDFFWESWSLATQEWFYLLFPLALLAIGNSFSIKKGIIIISVTFIIAALLYRISIHDGNYDMFWWGIHFRKVALSRIDCIFFGVLAAWVRFYHPERWNHVAIPAFITGILLYLLVAYSPKPTNSIYHNIIYLSLAPVYICLLFPLVDRLKDVKSIIGRLITKISILSYGMYLLNLMLIQLIDKHLSNVLSGSMTLKYTLYWLLTLILSYLLYILYESPIASYGNKVLHTSKMMYKRMQRS